MDGALPQLALVGALVLVNAAFAGSELALISLHEGQLKRLERRSETGRVLARLARDPNRFMATIQIGITLAGFLASATAAVALAEPLVEALDFLGGAAEPAAIVIVTLVLTFVTLVFGELAPKRVAMQRAERWGLLAARPVAGLARAARPVVWLLGVATNLAVRLLGGDPSVRREEVTEEELRHLVESQSGFSAAQRRIISGALEIGDRSLREIVVPRREVVTIEGDLTAAEALAQLVTSGRSRAPVVRGDLDQFVGVVHLRDLLGDGGTAAEHARPAPALPETLGVVEALRVLQTQRQQMAIVVNEYGGTEGIVTVEDLVEELVGEIYDETDRDLLTVEREPDGAVVLPGGFPVHDLPDLGIDLPEGDYATLAGLFLAHFGRIPENPGAVAQVGDWSLEVVETDGRAVTRVRIRRHPGRVAAEPGSREAS